MDTIKKIFKWITIGFLSLVVFIIVIVFIFGEEETIAPEATEQPTLGIYTIDGDDSLFDGLSDSTVKIWISDATDTLDDERTMVAKFDRGTEVELLQRGNADWYCKVQKDNHVGWLACDWLLER